MNALTPDERARYDRNIRLPEIAERGQIRLRETRVLLVGLGGLGSPAALYLAAAGIGSLGLADNDTVALHNLQRQILHRTGDIGRAKIDSAAETLRALNPGVALEAHPEGLTPANALSLVSRYDIVLDGSDNFAARRLANDACVLARKPLVSASVSRFSGQLAVFDPARGGPCYRCLYPEDPPEGAAPACGETGVLGALCGVLGAMQAVETVKLITGAGPDPRGRVLLYDGLTGLTRTIALRRDPDCPCCGDRPSITTIDLARYAPTACAAPENSMNDTPLEITAETARDLLVAPDAPLLLDVREADEVAACRIAGSLHIPMGEIPARLAELPAGRHIVAYCHHGGRSMRVTRFLREQGVPRVTNLAGGIDRWSRVIDPAIPRY